MEYELGRVTAHPLKHAFTEAICVIRTWIFCKRQGLECREWWGVYEKGTERPLAKFGCMPASRAMAADYLTALQNKEKP